MTAVTRFFSRPAICGKPGPEFGAVGPTLFRYGFVFALGLTFLPIPLALLAGAARMLRLIS